MTAETDSQSPRPTDALTRFPDRETNLAMLSRAIGLIENESIRLKGRPDSILRLSTEPGTYWTIQAQRGILPGYNADTPSLTATFKPKLNDGLPPFDSIRADITEMFGTRLGGIHLHLRTGERSWDEQADVARLAGLVDAYFTPKPSATEKAVAWAATVARSEMKDASSVKIGKYMVDVDPEKDKVTIRELDKKNATRRLIVSDPGASESPDGTPARPARIIAQDLKRGTIILEQKEARRILKRTMMQIFPNYTEKPVLDGSRDFA